MSIQTGNNGNGEGNGTGDIPEPRVSLGVLPERHLIRMSGSHRHVVFTVGVEAAPKPDQAARTPLRLALVIDRSGSMGGGELATAKQAVLAVLAQLDERDQVAVVAFDNEIDVLQPLAPINAQTKKSVHSALAKLEARGSTALHQGWLVGCQTIALASPIALADSTARCFLLTDGLANEGLQDPEAIAVQAAGVRANAGISTSTFGIGSGYNEQLLGPLAVAGGGQFHHLRSAADIGDTFLGEASDLRAVAARRVRLELALIPGMTADVVSAYWSDPASSDERVSADVGDLRAGEERRVVVRFGFPRPGSNSCALRARLVWLSASGECATDWQETAFTYADHAACDKEQRDATAMRAVGRHHAERAKLQATKLNSTGDAAGARKLLGKVARRIEEYAQGDADLQLALRELRDLDREIAEGRLDNLRSKEQSYQSLRMSRMQADYRRP